MELLSISAVSVSLYVPEAAVTTLTSTPVASVYSWASACHAASASGLKLR